ncbi:MAG: methylmalonyl-CoA mutase small subunit, partial [SAR324 cluster bacterium]|nr:methylmalonyl-CoA mutase small subunit [SAR324 cluster bacterium]
MMDKHNEENGLLEEFAVPTYEEWRALVEDQLQGVPFEKKLVSRTAEGIAVQPIYLRKDVQNLTSQVTPPGQFPFVRGTKASGNSYKSWAVSQPNRFPAADTFNQIACRDIDNGLTSLQITLDDAGKRGQDPDQSTVGVVGNNGLSIVNREDLRQALQGIDLTSIQVQLEGGLSGFALLLLLLEHLRSKNISFAALQGDMVFDPLAELAVSGSLPTSLDVIVDRMAHLAQLTGTLIPGFKTIGIDARPYCESGGSAAQELGFAMAAAVLYFKELQQRGLTVDEIAPAVSFKFAIGANFFLEIAKLRAARSLWARIVSLLGGSESSQKATLHAVSSRYNKTIHDPYVNMQRVTSETFSAVIGGSDVLSVTPFDDLFGLPDEMSSRIARNLQIVLKEECHGNRVIDPSGGSWFVENLTDQLAQSAWGVFQEVEKAGGMAKALQAGDVQKAIADVDRQRRKKFGQRQDVAVGTNMYANLTEVLPEKRQPDFGSLWQSRAEAAKKAKSAHKATSLLTQLAVLVSTRETKVADLVETAIQAVEKGVTLGELSAQILGAAGAGERVTPLSIKRKTEAYEALRQRAVEIAEQTGRAPTVFLANMGPLRQHKARAEFSTGFLQPGGFSVVSSSGFDTVEDAVSATLASEAGVV